MNSLLLTLALAFAPFVVTESVSAQSISDITRALGSGDLATLTDLMDAEVELSILADENTYAKEQARQKLTAFFAANTPSGFSQVHQGSSKSDNAEYCIGNLTTSNGVYRVYIYVAKKGERTVLQELRFDRE
ncbi:hypothetical protein LEM8419_02537 [Neolewinella maritima]|uniref:DUF4783 domain-containing protein n=1 Tax=Neolewinella maritima TaxID=1383882 RepID=A0ABM9B354_9BACT|nr:DUF4783 domain-containing protein [Neolewinella maritima]CAH1001632.1 hypothetical protein LEM8419_02537 [Neolewinella maritima]